MNNDNEQTLAASAEERGFEAIANSPLDERTRQPSFVPIVDVTKEQDTKEKNDICHDLLQTDPNKMHNNVIRHAYVGVYGPNVKGVQMNEWAKRIYDFAYKRGFERGHEEEKIQMALKMLEKGYDTESISELTGLGPERIREEERKAKARKAS